ncbi:hypothetical protein [Mycoplasma anserisalpingitidis]|uniref:DUF4231 domain-containing protein n=1 Tax=Mycoplasma anserisalpingitidis TaxID=519450 RepID=A0A5B8K1A7_9MOLU|nr:hypothetical protein [Mycoplasma anserisalpingitidis]QDY88621.1 hypothetical protein FOY43_03080 [Mycoplasma anserisalpingitidis]
MRKAKLKKRSELLSNHEKYKSVLRKYLVTKYCFVFLSVLTLVISSIIIILNLYSIRFNEYPHQTMIYFVSIAFISVVVTLLISVQSFFNITDKITVFEENINTNLKRIDKYKENNEITREDIDDLMKTF